jgi:hypothetical protein
MSLLINNDLIWVSIPKCASFSIETTLFKSNLNITPYSEYKYLIREKKMHAHYQLSTLFNEFGRKETVCITRDWLDRWVSGLEFLWKSINKDGINTIIAWEDVSNDFIYNTFNKEFSNILYTKSHNEWKSIFDKNIVKKGYDISNKFTDFSMLCVLLSQNYWKENKACTYEFNIKEIHKFEEFIQKRYSVSFKIPHLNSTKKIKNKIEINDELKNYLWNVFEKPFEKRNALI